MTYSFEHLAPIEPNEPLSYTPVILFGILGSYLFHHIGKVSAKIHEIGKIKAVFGLGMTPI